MGIKRGDIIFSREPRKGGWRPRFIIVEFVGAGKAACLYPDMSIQRLSLDYIRNETLYGTWRLQEHLEGPNDVDE